MKKKKVNYSKKEKEIIASRCGYNYVYSGKNKRGYFIKLESTQNVKGDPADLKLLNELILVEK
jgi:hypothetical protein